MTEVGVRDACPPAYCLTGQASQKRWNDGLTLRSLSLLRYSLESLKRHILFPSGRVNIGQA